MLFASMEQPDGTFGGSAPAIAAAAAGRAFVRSFPPLLVLLPAVAAAAVSGGALGHAALPASIAWGLLAAATACSGGGTLLDQLLWRPLVSSRDRYYDCAGAWRWAAGRCCYMAAGIACSARLLLCAQCSLHAMSSPAPACAGAVGAHRGSGRGRGLPGGAAAQAAAAVGQHIWRRTGRQASQGASQRHSHSSSRCGGA